MKKALMNASVASMIYKFNMDNIEILEHLGYQVDVACNFGKENPIGKKEICKFKNILKEKGIRVFETECPRTIFAFGKMIKTYLQLKKIINSEKYDLIHTQSPIGGVLCRLACVRARRQGTKVIYTAHGFHFYKGAPIQNWLLFYPVEKLCSKLNDVLITINKEDYKRAKEHFHTPVVKKIPGVGVDILYLSSCAVTKAEKRKELGIPEEAFVLLSIGELSERKNHKIVIDALGMIKNPSIHYVIAGKGELYESYLKSANDKGLGKQLHLLGPRIDINELCVAADVFVHPSVREGLGIAPLEGMAAGLPLISSYVNGIKDYTKDGVTGCCLINPMDAKAMSEAILKMNKNKTFRSHCSQKNKKIANMFSLEKSKEILKNIYISIND